MTLQEFKTKTKWSPDNGLDSRANYVGPDLSAWLKGPGRSRDSEILDESNFESALEMLGGESDTVEVHRFGHWACGWFEQILVRADDKAKVKVLFEIHQALENYPVLDEDDYFERETEYHLDYAKGAKDELASALVLHLGLPEELSADEDMLELCVELNIECQRYYGNDSCINVYDRREPDEHDWERVVNCLEQISYNYRHSENPAFDYLSAAFDIGGAQ